MDSSTPFIQSGWANFRQPATIAVLASVGIHALFALNLERISLFPQTAQLPPSVELVELSTDQVEGIYPKPQKLALSEVPVPSSLSSILGGGPTVPPFPSSPPPPSPTFIPSTPSPGFTVPATPPSSRSRGTSLPPIVNTSPDNLSLGTLPPSVNIPSYTPNIPIYTPPELPSSPEINTFPDKNLEELDRAREFYEQLDGGQIVFSPNPTGADIFDPDRITPDEPGSEPPRFTPPPESNNNLAVNPDFDPEPNPPVPPEEFRGSLLAKLEAGRDREDNTEQTANSESNSPVFETQPPPPEGEVSDRETAMLEGGSLFVNWVLPILESYPNLRTASPMVFSDIYPLEACERQLTGEALVGVVIGSNGEILAGPELLLDSGYPVLDNYAVQKVDEFVSTQAVGGENPTAYQYAFDFNSNNCGEVSSPEDATPENAQSSPDNSTPAVTPSEADLENQIEPTTEEDFSEPETPETEPEAVEPTVEEDFSEPEVTEPEAVEPTVEEDFSEPEVTEPETPETEPEVLEPEAVEPTVEEDFSEPEPPETEP
ncbi:MAG: hypothetical protein AAFO04_26680, partial [Cyanobacteria bacterium J06592_8]